MTQHEIEEIDVSEHASEEDAIRTLAKLIDDRLKANNDCWVAVSGPEGSGKSTLAIKLAQAIEGDRFDVEKNIVVNPTIEILEKLILHSDVRAIVIDEAIFVAFSREHAKKENIFFVKLAALCRKENKCIILCIPRFRSLDSAIRNARIRLWLYVPERSYCVVMAPDLKNPFTMDCWNLKLNERVMDQAFSKGKTAAITTELLIKHLQKCKNYWFSFRFSKMQDLIENKYLNLVKEFRKNVSFLDKNAKDQENSVITKEMDEFL